MRVLAWAVAAAAAGLQLGATGTAVMEAPPLLHHQLPIFIQQQSNTLGTNNASLGCCHVSAHLREVLTLSELPLERLLRVQLAMHPRPDPEPQPEPEPEQDHDLEQGDVNREGEALPHAEALRSRHRARRPPSSNVALQRGDLLESGGASLGTKQSKLATGFQLAITVLSFLAFGAYLISLVVSIVRNNNTSGTATTQQPFVLVPATAGRRRKRRRADPPWMPPRLPEPEHVFSAITALARAYARFEGHEVDL